MLFRSGPFFADHGVELSLEVLAPGAHQVSLRARLTTIFASKTADEWRAYASAHDVCLEVVSTPEEWRDDAQRVALARGRDPLKLPMPLGSPAEGPAPRQGANSAEILEDAGVTRARR